MPSPAGSYHHPMLLHDPHTCSVPHTSPSPLPSTGMPAMHKGFGAAFPPCSAVPGSMGSALCCTMALSARRAARSICQSGSRQVQSFIVLCCVS